MAQRRSGQVVVSEEVGVRRDGQGDGWEPGEVVDAQVESAEGLTDVGAHGGVHEAGVQRHAGDHGPRLLGVGPRPRPNLEQFQREPE